MTEKEFRALLALEGKKLVIEVYKDDWGKRRWSPSVRDADAIWFPATRMYTTKSNAVRAAITKYYRHGNHR